MRRTVLLGILTLTVGVIVVTNAMAQEEPFETGYKRIDAVVNDVDFEYIDYHIRLATKRAPAFQRRAPLDHAVLGDQPPVSAHEFREVGL